MLACYEFVKDMEKNQPTIQTLRKTEVAKISTCRHLDLTSISQPLLAEKKAGKVDCSQDSIELEAIESESLTKKKLEFAEDIPVGPEKCDDNTDFRPKFFHTVCLCGTRFVLVSFLAHLSTKCSW